MLFDSTVRQELARTFGATLVVILTIVLTMMLIRTLGQAAGGAVAPGDVVLLLGYTALGHLPTMLNMSLFVAVVVALGRMYRDSEMSVWFASGVGLSRFVRPTLRMSWPVLVVVAALTLFVWPWGNRNSTELRERYQQRGDLSRVTPGQFMQSRDGSRVFFIERGAAVDANGANGAAGSAKNVFILAREGERESVTSAKSGRIETQGGDRMLVLDKGQRNEERLDTGEKSLARFDRYSVLIDDAASRGADALPPRARSSVDLLLQPTSRNLGELVWRLGLVFGGANLLLLGLGLAATNPRRASNWNLLFALLGFIVYFNLINLSQAWVANGRLGMGGALLLLHGGVFALALGLLWWREHGSSLRLRAATP
jgi:lipopolysaccharide export system permease protein